MSAKWCIRLQTFLKTIPFFNTLTKIFEMVDRYQ
jgi:hypothetical protein